MESEKAKKENFAENININYLRLINFILNEKQ